MSSARPAARLARRRLPHQHENGSTGIARGAGPCGGAAGRHPRAGRQARRADAGPGGARRSSSRPRALAYARLCDRSRRPGRAAARAARAAAPRLPAPARRRAERRLARAGRLRPAARRAAVAGRRGGGRARRPRRRALRLAGRSRRCATGRAPRRCSSASPARGPPCATASTVDPALRRQRRGVRQAASSSPGPSWPCSARSTRARRHARRSPTRRPSERALEGARRPAAGLRLAARAARLARRRRRARSRRCSTARACRALGARRAPTTRGLRVRVRSAGTGGAQLRPAPRSPTACPPGPIALLAAPDLAPVVAAASRRAGTRPPRSTPCAATLPSRPRSTSTATCSGCWSGGFTAWLAPGDAAPVIGLAARTDDPKALREALARLQDPVARAARGRPEAPPVFRRARSPAPTRTRCASSDGFAPTYAVAGKTVVVATAPPAVEAFLAARRRACGTARASARRSPWYRREPSR